MSAVFFLRCLFLASSGLEGAVLFLDHYDDSLDAGHSLFGEPNADAAGMKLSLEGRGYPFKGVPKNRALDAGYTSSANREAVVRYSAVNLDSRRGTIEMWVKPSWASDPPRARKTDQFHHFLSAPLENKGSLQLYYACYRWNHFLPHIVFHINDGRPVRKGRPGPDYIVSFRVSPDEKHQGFVWEKDTWHYLVATWTPTMLRLFADGKLMVERKLEEPIDIPAIAGPLCIGNSSGNWGGKGWLAEALIDDVRISDAPLYNGKKKIPVPTMPLADEIRGETLAAGGFATLTRPDPRQYYCYRTGSPPVIDGKLDDEVWKKLPVWSGFLAYGKYDENIPQQTELRMCRDDENIYVGAFLWEDRLDLLKKVGEPGKDDVHVFADDCIEFYFGPKQNKVPDVQIGINSRNALCDLLHTKGRADFKWNGKSRSATGMVGDGWIVELVFPYRDVGEPPEIGDIWGFRGGRNHKGSAGRLSAVNYATTGFQNPVEFARLIMAGDIPRLDLAEEDFKLNRDYVVRLRKQAAEFVNEARRQLDFAADIPPAVKAKHGLKSLEDEVGVVTQQADELARSTAHLRIRKWNHLSLALKTTSEKLDRFAYLIASVGGAQASIPPISLSGIQQADGFWYLASKELAAAVDTRRGMVAGIWDRRTKQRLAVSSYFLYHLQTRTDEKKFDERSDQVRRVTLQDGRLVIESANPDLPGIQIEKQYFLEKVGEESRILCRRLEVSGKVKEMSLLQVTSRTLFDESYRSGAFYHRIFVIGTIGDNRSFVSAPEITIPTLQRGWFNSSEGRAQFALLQPAQQTGLAEYLFKENDSWTFPQAMPASYWTPFGWDMGFAAAFVKPEPYSAELRFHLFRGDRLTFHQEYMRLPEFAEVRQSQLPSAKVGKISAVMGTQAGQAIHDSPGVRKYVQATVGSMKELLRPDELGLSAWSPHDTRWPDLPAEDGAELMQTHNNRSGVILHKWPAKGLRQSLERIRKLNPNLLSNTYNFIVDIYKGSQAFREHPEWIARKRDGKPLEGFFGTEYVRANFSPEFIRHLTERLLANCDYFGLDICYLDFSVGIVVPDWGRGEVITLSRYLSFVRRLQSELHQRGKILWLNSFVGQPYFDMGFFEGLGSGRHWGKSWRDWAEVVLMSKFYLQPGAVRIPLYFLAGDMFRDRGTNNEVPYIDMVLASGHMSAGCYLDPYHEHFPAEGGGADWKAIYQYTTAVHHAAFELRNSEWADIGLEPAWWRDLSTNIEAYTLRIPQQVGAGRTNLVNIISHEKEAIDIPLTVDLGRMGFDPEKRLFVWQFLRRDYSKYPKQVPVPTNWNEMFSNRTCTSSVPGADRFRYIIPKLGPNRVCITALTQTPAALISAAGIPTQTLLPSTLNCTITGGADEKARLVRLQVQCDKPVEVIAWWPAAWGKAGITAGKKELKSTAASFGTEQFLRFPLTTGIWNVTIRTVDKEKSPAQE